MCEVVRASEIINRVQLISLPIDIDIHDGKLLHRTFGFATVTQYDIPSSREDALVFRSAWVHPVFPLKCLPPELELALAPVPWWAHFPPKLSWCVKRAVSHDRFSKPLGRRDYWLRTQSRIAVVFLLELLSYSTISFRDTHHADMHAFAKSEVINKAIEAACHHSPISHITYTVRLHYRCFPFFL